MTMGLTAVTALIALIMWSETFRKVHVVSAEGTSLTFQVDGGEVQTVAQSASEDAPAATFEVRTSATHQVTVKGKNGRESTFRLDPSVARHGWVLAPHARENDLCLTSVTWYYGTTPKDDGKILNADGTELLVLPNDFDFMFQQPPSSVVKSAPSAVGDVDRRQRLELLHGVATEAGAAEGAERGARRTEREAVDERQSVERSRRSASRPGACPAGSASCCSSRS